MKATKPLTVEKVQENQSTLRIRLGRIIRAYRTEKKLSGKEIADGMGYSAQHYSEFEKGLKIPAEITALLKLADQLDRDRGWLLQSAWDARDDRTLPIRLPEDGDPRRKQLIDLVLDVYRNDTPRLP